LYGSIIAANDFALGTIEADSPSWLVYLFFRAHTASLISTSFTFAIDVFLERMGEIFTLCHAAVERLEELDRILGVVHEIVSRERIALINERDEVLEQLWTSLGGNKRRLRGLGDHLQLVGAVANYRMKALQHVHRTMETVAGLREDVLYMRTNVAVVDQLVAALTPEAMKVHLYSIRAGMVRIAESMGHARLKASEIRETALKSANAELAI
jgi:hypothetical protein